MVEKRIVIEIASELLAEIDQLIARHMFADRGEFIEAAVSHQIAQFRRSRLADACLRLDADEERGLAEEGIGLTYLPSEEY
jgi:metal-responsive CopG/Arc/MetJ family transcriptional regulator